MQEYKIFYSGKDEDGHAVPHALVTARLNLPDYTEAGVKFPNGSQAPRPMKPDSVFWNCLLIWTAQHKAAGFFEITSTHQDVVTTTLYLARRYPAYARHAGRSG